MIYKEYIGKNKKKETRRMHAQPLRDLCNTKKEMSFLLTKQIWKKDDSKHHVFVCEDLTPLSTNC